LHYFLGLEVSRLPKGIVLSQHKFTQELLQDAAISTLTPVATPLPLNCKLTSTEDSSLDDPTHYRGLIGKLNFLSHTRPDLSFAVQHLSQFMQTTHTHHLHALIHLLRYLKGTAGQGILLKASDQLTLTAFSDFDWASCPSTRRSITGHAILFGSSLISWKSKKQHTVSKSSNEVEYRAMSHATSEITWLVRLLAELGVHSLKPVTLFCDNQSAMHIARNPVFHKRTKHI